MPPIISAAEAVAPAVAAGIVGEANSAAERQFGLPMLRLKGRPLTLLVDSLDHGRLFTALGRLRDGGEWVRQEFRYLGPHAEGDATVVRVVEFSRFGDPVSIPQPE